MDLYDPGSGSQVHDFNGGIDKAGLFWTVKVPASALIITNNGAEATLTLVDAKVIDSFSFPPPPDTRPVPATVSLEVHWAARNPDNFIERGKGSQVPPDSPKAFLGRFAIADAEGTFSGSNAQGFSFTSTDEAESIWAEIGTEKNGAFLS